MRTSYRRHRKVSIKKSFFAVCATVALTCASIVNSGGIAQADVVTDRTSWHGVTPYYAPVSGNTAKPANSKLVAVKGTYINSEAGSDRAAVLAYMNKIRKEAVNYGHSTKYVALQWNTRLERSAQIRAAEISIYGDHTRPSGEKWYGISDEGFAATYAENLSWGSTYLGNVELWAKEGDNYVKHLACKKVTPNAACYYGVTGHYTTLINPQYTYVGFAEFKTDRTTVNPYGSAMAAEFSYSVPTSGSAYPVPSGSEVYQGVYAKTAALGTIASNGTRTFSPSYVSGDPVWKRAATVYDTDKLVANLQSQFTTPVNTLTSGGATWQRLYGSGVFDTMQAIVKKGFTQTGGTVLIATSNGFYDALTASGLAGIYGAPLLMTSPSSLPSQTKAELQRLKPSRIILVGGTSAISANVANSIKSVTGVTPVRYAGATAFDTADAIASAGVGKWSDTGIIVTSRSFQDALSSAPYAYAKKTPIFLTNAAGTALTAHSIATMKQLGIKKVYIVGGAAAVTEQVVTQLKNNGITLASRIWGSDGIATSKAFANFAISQGMSANNMGVATSASYYDALSGAAFNGKNNSVLVLASNTNTSAASGVYTANKSSVKNAYLYGGVYAISNAAFKSIAGVS
ncbi:MAG: cell wall-binding repeat-containing protein [Actinomycetaceae bacterium]|nr:cell wall-binding repeat-containing protein [Actinomycetaceae bacterium]